MTSITIHPETPEQENALKAFAKALKMKFEVIEEGKEKVGEEPYDPEFVTRVQEARQQVKEGKTVKITLDEIWKE